MLRISISGLFLFLALCGHLDAKPIAVKRQAGYSSKCKEVQVSPGIWNFTCTPPSDDKITLSLEHIVQFKNSDLSQQAPPKVLNIDVPNYKIKQVIRPQLLDEEDGKNSTLTVNIQLLKPDIETDRQEQIPTSGEERHPPQPPNVVIQYPQVTEFERRDPKMEGGNKDYEGGDEKVGEALTT